MYWILKWTLGPIIQLIWIKEVDGLKKLPSNGPCIVAANHGSYFDFLGLTAIMPRRITFLAAEVFYKSKFWRPIMMMTGQIKIDRNSSDKSNPIGQANSILQQGNVLGIFPEGTRTRTGKIQKAYTGVARLARENKCPIIPVAISGAYEVMSPHDKFPKFKKIIKYKFLKPILFEDISKNNDEEIIIKLMKTIAHEANDEYDF